MASLVPVCPGDGESIYMISGSAVVTTFRLTLASAGVEKKEEEIAIYPSPAALTVEIPEARGGKVRLVDLL